ncbi:hypothetical protein POTOM_061312 [Populus tomentosa]|uniref:FIST C-domain domain-containing protein n=1 Tax=Populus tomentosa TaxID=118781 RepID=A0A8X7XYL2_POPTO|nr:hypothetical protein POTOM_061312 [Populus tomentosa]
MERKPKEPRTPLTGFASINEDLVQNILKRTPATSFAAAACVCKSWNQTCNQILSKPKLASAFSLNPDQKVASQEVVNKVLSEPIRPQFAIANVIGSGVDLSETLNFLAAKLGSKTPIIVSCANGIIGRDAVTDEHQEVMLEDFWADAASKNSGFGVLLTVGFFPGLQVEAIPLLRPRKAASGMAMVDKFVMDIRNYSANVSGSTSPALLIMFGGEKAEQKPVMEKLDHATSRETFIAGDQRAQFLYKSGIESRNVHGSGNEYISDAVVLVFARDRHRASGDGEHLFVSGDGIGSGDYFHFYHSDPKAALSSTSNVSKNFRNLKLDWRSCQLHAGGVGSKEVVGGLVFSCWGRGESFFGHSNVDSSPFLDNFPGIPMAGIFCYGEVGRGFTITSKALEFVHLLIDGLPEVLMTLSTIAKGAYDSEYIPSLLCLTSFAYKSEDVMCQPDQLDDPKLGDDYPRDSIARIRVPITDNYASLRRENRELKLEISRMRVSLSELEKEQMYMKQGMIDKGAGSYFFKGVAAGGGRWLEVVEERFAIPCTSIGHGGRGMGLLPFVMVGRHGSPVFSINEDPKAALSSTSNVSKNFRNLKLDWRSCQLHAGGVGSKEVVGGLVFSCWGRGESFFGHSNVDSSPFLDNFPGIPMAGIFCYGEVGRVFTLLNADDHEDHEEQTSCCCLHVYSTIYVLVSYTPAPLKH